MSKLTDQQKSFIRLIKRSDDKGEGWRQVSQQVWPLVESAKLPNELLEIDHEGRRIRLTDQGETVAKYL